MKREQKVLKSRSLKRPAGGRVGHVQGRSRQRVEKPKERMRMGMNERSERYLAIMRSGNRDTRAGLLNELPPSPMKDSTAFMFASENDAMQVMALSTLVIAYGHGQAADIAGDLARAAYAFSREVFERQGPAGPLLLCTVSVIASGGLNALNLVGRYAEAVAFADEVVPFLEALGDDANLPDIYAHKIEALIGLQQIDKALQLLVWAEARPKQSVHLARLRKKLDDLMRPAMNMPSAVRSEGSEMTPEAFRELADFLDSGVECLMKSIGSTPSSALPQDKRTAWPHLVCDESAVIGLPFDVEIGLRGKPDPNVGGMGKMSLPAQGCTLDIQIVFDPESLAIVEGEQSFRLEVSSGDHYPLRTLKMVALAGADLQQQREIVVTYGLNGVLVGCACRSVCAVENLNARPPSGTTPSSSRMELTRDKSEAKADLTIIIKHGDDTGNRRLIFSATSPHVSLPVSDKPTSVDIGDEPSKFLADTAKMASGGLKPWQLFLILKGRGKQVAAKMPARIKEELREVAARIAPRIASVLIVSDDPYMPWELAVFDPPLGSHEADSSPFLGAQVACGRWILSQDERPSPDPNRCLAVRQQVVVSGAYDQIPGWPRLKDAEQEAAELLKFWDGTSEPVEATFADVVNCLEGKPAADVLHFALHGKVDPHGLQDGLVLIEQSVDKSSPASPIFLSPDVVEGCAFDKYGRSPFVFLNACQVGAGREVLGDYAGLTAAFLKAGASAVVAPLWSINDADARRLALELYKRASEGEAPAEILRSQRSRFTEQAAKGNAPNHGSPTHLAYQFFGHPNYILKPEKPTIGFNGLAKPGGEMNEWAANKTIRQVDRVFMDKTQCRNPELLGKALTTLAPVEAWARSGHTDVHNDVLWRIYLCHSRRNEPSEAADAVQCLRYNVEKTRAGILDPLKRAGAGAKFPYLYQSLCQMLQKAGRVEDLLGAIEASKGRAVADVMAARSHLLVDETEFAEPAKRMGALMRCNRAHYLSYFVDDDYTLAVLVDKDGALHEAGLIDLGKQRIRNASRHVDPRSWGELDPADPAGPGVEDISEAMQPLVNWMEPLFDSGVIEEGDHICYSPDECLHQFPLGYVKFKGKFLAQSVSLSRTHGARTLAMLLSSEIARPQASVSVEVPAKQDLGIPGMVDNLRAPGTWLAQHLPGDVYRDGKATLASLSRADLAGKLVHFATHGMFPPEDANYPKNPFDSSGLALAGSRGALPDKVRLAQGDDDKNLLTPAMALEAGLDFTGSHVTLQACVTGLAREGLGGDALGLDWAFFQLGVSSLLSAHWYVSAELSSEFCQRFYRAWLEKGMSRACAWRETVVDMMDEPGEKGTPYAWAAFSLSGDWR